MLQNVAKKRLVSVGVVCSSDGERFLKSSVVGKERERYTDVDESVGSHEALNWIG